MTRILSVTGVRDEGPFLLEWLAWHRLLGVTDFIVFTNDCRDGTDQMLNALSAAGVVVHIPQSAQPGKSVQWQALKSAWDHPLRRMADWMLISDVDEFPMIHAGGYRFADLLAGLPGDTDAVALAWRLFGANGVVRFDDTTVTGQFQRSAPEEMIHPVAATYFKTLFRPSAFDRPGVHRPTRDDARAPAVWMDGSGRPLAPLYAGQNRRLSLLPLTGVRNLAEMHHYSLRSAESFVVKSERGLPNRTTKQVDLRYWIERNYNTVSNMAAVALQDELAQEIAVLKSLPGLTALHDAACAWHREQAARLLRETEFFQLFCDCLHAGNSTVLPPGLATDLLRRFQELRMQSS